MNLLKSVETTIANLVEGTFGRVFRSEVRPIELARRLTREMDAHRTVSLARVYVPNEYSVWLSRADRERYEGVEEEVIDELSAHLLEHARREELIMASHPSISFHTDERLALGEFGIQVRLTRPPERGEEQHPPRRELEAEEHGNTMIYSTSVGGPVVDAHARRGSPRALLAVGGRRLLVPDTGATIGRSRDCDVVLADANVSRRHAELRPAGGAWVVEDLGSTNGVKINGRRITAASALNAGDQIELGTSSLTFELE
jgi:hypothetical protein